MPKNHIKAILKSYHKYLVLDQHIDMLLVYKPEGNRSDMQDILKDFCGKPFNAEMLEEYAEKILSLQASQPAEPKYTKKFKKVETED